MHKKDIGETDQQPEAEVKSHSSPNLAGGDTHADDGEDKRGKGIGDHLVFLNLELDDVGTTPHLHAFDIFAQLGIGELLLDTLGILGELRGWKAITVSMRLPVV